MKKLLSILSIAIFVVSLSSCAKIHTCECTPKAGGASSKYEIAASSKKEAKLSCEEANVEADDLYTCVLK